MSKQFRNGLVVEDKVKGENIKPWHEQRKNYLINVNQQAYIAIYSVIS